ncbi:MAG: mechanosensitive ion channel family protein [Crocinitomicaceae bacterium]|nr:mechanosensitive ion channel family protein [Flavobacteriales bacterium]NQZ36440.1 mechanosensitive ion channel family protein [Crocinitomicaceae bacterium]
MQEITMNFINLHAVEIIWIFVLFFLGKMILKVTIKHFVKLADDGDDSHTSQKEKRAKTLGHIIKSIGNIVIYSVILFMVLNLSGVDIRPILASAGIVALAISFGAQSIVKDFISGLFILIENQYGLGDKVKIGNFEGEVIKITMRSTVLMNDEKKVYYISNGLIKDVVNMSQRK